MPEHASKSTALTRPQQDVLLAIACRSIHHGLTTGRPLTIEAGELEAPLCEPRATFVTLERSGALRGCIGTLEAVRMLAEDVAASAYAAAFRDPRFPPLSPAETDHLDIHISILSPPEPLTFRSEAELKSQIRPGVDGLLLEDGGCRGTFLPSVWESLPQVEPFWEHLKVKAGLPTDYWSSTLRVSRYTCQSVCGRYSAPRSNEPSVGGWPTML